MVVVTSTLFFRKIRAFPGIFSCETFYYKCAIYSFLNAGKFCVVFSSSPAFKVKVGNKEVGCEWVLI